MAAPTPAAPSDRDLASIAEARALARRAKTAQSLLAEFSQQQIDAIVDAMAKAAESQAGPLAQLSVEETGFGVVADKVQKNLFSARQVYEFIRPMKTGGVGKRSEEREEGARGGDPDRGSQGHRERRAVWRRRGDRAVDEPDVHGDLQDPDRH